MHGGLPSHGPVVSSVAPNSTKEGLPMLCDKPLLLILLISVCHIGYSHAPGAGGLTSLAAQLAFAGYTCCHTRLPGCWLYELQHKGSHAADVLLMPREGSCAAVTCLLPARADTLLRFLRETRGLRHCPCACSLPVRHCWLQPCVCGRHHLGKPLRCPVHWASMLLPGRVPVQRCHGHIHPHHWWHQRCWR